MKRIVLPLLLLLVFSMVAFAIIQGKPTFKESEKTGFAIVELFTSQGCSSCPPADAYLSRLIERANTTNEHIIVLSFHVSYWNRLGWTDPFSDQSFTARQQQYAQKFGNNTIYTPQMIVNGNKAFESSRQSVIDRGIDVGLNTPPDFQLGLGDVKIDKNKLDFVINLDKPAKDLHLNLALVERGLTTVIKAGENGGRTLIHDNVVRSFATLTLNNESHKTGGLPLPEGMNAKNASLIVLPPIAQNYEKYWAPLNYTWMH